MPSIAEGEATEHCGAAVIGPLDGNCHRRCFAPLVIEGNPASGGVKKLLRPMLLTSIVTRPQDSA